MSSTFEEAIRRYWQQHPQFAQQAADEGFPLDQGKLPIKAVLFDMDGVLFDSMPAHAKAWVAACREQGLEISEEEVYLNEGRTALTTVEWVMQRQFNRSTTPEEAASIYARKSDIFNTFPEASKMPGAEALLRQIKAEGRTIVVVTGSGQASLLERLTLHYPDFFDLHRIVSSKDVQYGKPHPEPYLMGLEKAGGLRPWEAIVVENAPLGVKAAVAAGCFTVAANTGPIPPDALLQEGCDLLFPSMSALAEQWAQLALRLT